MVFTRLQVSFPLDYGHMKGSCGPSSPWGRTTWWVTEFFPGTSWRLHQVGELRTENNEIGIDKDEWAVPACLRACTCLDYTFLPEEAVACIAGKHFHLRWRSSWDGFSSDEGMERSWDLRLQCWASVLLATLTSYGAPALPAPSEIQRLRA